MKAGSDNWMRERKKKTWDSDKSFPIRDFIPNKGKGEILKVAMPSGKYDENM